MAKVQIKFDTTRDVRIGWKFPGQAKKLIKFHTRRSPGLSSKKSGLNKKYLALTPVSIKT